MFKQNDTESDNITIFPWKEGTPLYIEWKEEENWDDICKKYEVSDYDMYRDFIQEKSEDYILKSDFEYPFSVMVYEFTNHFMISKSQIQEFYDIRDCCVVPKNYLNVVLFYKEMCQPFI